MELSN